MWCICRIRCLCTTRGTSRCVVCTIAMKTSLLKKYACTYRVTGFFLLTCGPDFCKKIPNIDSYTICPPSGLSRRVFRKQSSALSEANFHPACNDSVLDMLLWDIALGCEHFMTLVRLQFCFTYTLAVLTNGIYERLLLVWVLKVFVINVANLMTSQMKKLRISATGIQFWQAMTSAKSAPRHLR